MTLGLTTSYIITFTLLPSLLNFFSSEKTNIHDKSKKLLTTKLSQYSIDYKKIIFSTTIVVIVLSFIGISKLEVENSFINYFSKKTEIYKGMKLIDEKLGGTTPLDVILNFHNKKDD